MKHTNLTIGRLGLILAAAIFSLGLAGCGKQEEAKSKTPEPQPEKASPPDPEKKEGPKVADTPPPVKKEEKAPVKADPPAPAPVPSPPPVPGPAAVTSGAISQNIKGYWAVDKDAMIKMAKEQMAKEAGEVNPEMEQMMIQMITSMAGSVMMEFSDGGAARMHSPAGGEDATYKILTADDKTGVFTIEIKPGDKNAKVAEGKLTGDKLTMTADGEPIALGRITAEEFEKRKASAGDALKGAVEALGKQLQDNIPDDLKEQLGDKIPPIPTPPTPTTPE